MSGVLTTYTKSRLAPKIHTFKDDSMEYPMVIIGEVSQGEISIHFDCADDVEKFMDDMFKVAEELSSFLLDQPRDSSEGDES